MIEKPKKLNVLSPKEVKRFKILVLGDAGVGKTSILEKYINNSFDQKYNPTIAVDFKTQQQDGGQFTYQMNFWDFSGHPEFFEVRNEFYKEANSMILVLDVTLKQSLDGLDMWLREANEMGAINIPTIVVGNKKDKNNRSISENDAFSWSKSRKFPYFEVSAADGSGINDLFKELLNLLTK